MSLMQVKCLVNGVEYHSSLVGPKVTDEEKVADIFQQIFKYLAQSKSPELAKVQAMSQVAVGWAMFLLVDSENADFIKVKEESRKELLSLILDDIEPKEKDRMLKAIHEVIEDELYEDDDDEDLEDDEDDEEEEDEDGEDVEEEVEDDGEEDDEDEEEEELEPLEEEEEETEDEEEPVIKELPKDK